MDCNEAQSVLKLGTLGHEVGQDRDTLALRSHLSECDSCRLAFQAQQQFDNQIAQAMSDVPTPIGMKDRLRQSIQNAEGQVASEVRSASHRMSRRAILVVVALVVPLLIWVGASFATRVTPLTEADVRRLAEHDIDSLPVALNTEFHRPAGWDRVRGIQFDESLHVARSGAREIPVLPLKVRVNSRMPLVSGFLIRLQKFQTAEPLRSFGDATIQYSSFGSWVAWKEGDSVFVCVLRDSRTMELLRNAIVNSKGIS